MVVRRRPHVIQAFAPAASRYQWYMDGKPISGETGATLTVTLPNVGDTHTYKVVAYRDDDNYTVSETATLIAVREGTMVRFQEDVPCRCGEMKIELAEACRRVQVRSGSQTR